MKKKLFFCDITLKELKNLDEYAKNVPRLEVVFELFQHFWYNLDDKKRQAERENDTRMGSIWVYLDDDGVLHLDITPRFSFNEHPEILELLNKLQDSYLK